MAEKPRYVRSSVREYPYTEQRDGMVAQDMDGDGRILTMRVPDENGTWKVSSADHRLLVPRDPAEEGGGPYYRLLTEGEVQNFDGVTIKPAPALAGLDMNRNYPIEWRPEGEQPGAGPYPTSEPEIRAVVQAHRRPAEHHRLHPVPHVLGRPPAPVRHEGRRRAADVRPAGVQEDRRQGDRAHGLPGGVRVPRLQVRPEGRHHRRGRRLGLRPPRVCSRGRPSSGTRSRRRASRTTRSSSGWWSTPSTTTSSCWRTPTSSSAARASSTGTSSTTRSWVRWSSAGWNVGVLDPQPAAWRLLEAEVAPHADWAIWHVLIAPSLSLRTLTASALGEGVVAGAAGRREHGLAADERHPEGAGPQGGEAVGLPIVEGEGTACRSSAPTRRQELGQLAGRVGKHSMLGGFGVVDGRHRRPGQWPSGSCGRRPGRRCAVEARHDRAGVVRATVVLDGAPEASRGK